MKQDRKPRNKLSTANPFSAKMLKTNTGEKSVFSVSGTRKIAISMQKNEARPLISHQLQKSTQN